MTDAPKTYSVWMYLGDNPRFGTYGKCIRGFDDFKPSPGHNRLFTGLTAEVADECVKRINEGQPKE